MFLDEPPGHRQRQLFTAAGAFPAAVMGKALDCFEVGGGPVVGDCQHRFAVLGGEADGGLLVFRTVVLKAVDYQIEQHSLQLVIVYPDAYAGGEP